MDMTDRLMTFEAAAARLPEDPQNLRFALGLRHGSMVSGLYAPQGIDQPQPHG